MFDWWNSLELATQIFYCIAIPSTLILLVQTVLTFMGIGDGVDADADVDVDGDVDEDDLTLISRYCVGWDVTFGPQG